MPQLTRAENGGALFLFGNIACIQAIRKKGENDSVYSMILVDYSKCTGCRTCEAVCAATNSRVMVGGEFSRETGCFFIFNCKTRLHADFASRR